MYGIPREKLLQQADDFTREYGFEDRSELFRKAALLAQSPKKFEEMPELTEDEKEAIRRETTRKLPDYVSSTFTKIASRSMESNSRTIYDCIHL